MTNKIATTIEEASEYTGINDRTDEKSSGLGLYLAVKATKLIGAELNAESRKGYGSSFSVIFHKSN